MITWTLTKLWGMTKMARKGPRQQFFVCASVSDKGELITKTVPAASPDEAMKIFSEQHSHNPREILGPFFKKRAQIIENTREMKFSNQIKKAVYNDWIVSAVLLTEPADQAYLVFIKRVDDKKIPTPKGTIVVPTSDLRFM